ncbi:MAG: RNA polymerase factor sigma-54 [Simkaniaceae bacterium]
MNNFRLELKQNVKTDQRLIITTALRQALHVLQMPVIELSAWVQQQIEQNPILEIDPEDIRSHEEIYSSFEVKELNFEEQNFSLYEEMDELFTNSLFPNYLQKKNLDILENCSKTPSVYETLRKQIALQFNGLEKAFAMAVADHLDHKGFLNSAHFHEIAARFQIKLEKAEKILLRFQQLEPLGIGSRSIQEYLLIQLKERKQEHGLLFKILDQHYSDLLHQRFFKIQKKLKVSSSRINSLISNTLRKLKKYPLENFQEERLSPLKEDILLQLVNNQWKITVQDTIGKPIKLHQKYIDYLHSQENLRNTWEKQFIRRHLASAKWLSRIIERRKSILAKVAHLVLSKQEQYFLGESPYLHPFSIREAAMQLEMHESTVARAVQGKFLKCDHGIFPLKNFFPSSLDENISTQKAKELLSSLIKKENKHKPFSDLELALEFSRKGISIARRTIAKYRKDLNIPNQKGRIVL